MKHIVTIGGGTGTFVVLSGLRTLPEVQLTAIVSEADDGGSTGRLRDAYGFLPAGDARQALVALAEDGNVLRDLFAYRFDKSDLAGHNLGNLFITALEDLLGSGVKALEEASRILRIAGTVIPATEKAATLVATLEDGTKLIGEHTIDERAPHRPRIRELSYDAPIALSGDAAAAIKNADLIVLGPGDLYTSSVAALLPGGMREAIVASKARIVYLLNLFTKAGQTTGYTAKEHVEEIARYAGRPPDVVLAHDGSFPDEVLARYAAEDEYPITADILSNGSKVVKLALASVQPAAKANGDALPRSFIRHDSAKIAAAIKELL